MSKSYPDYMRARYWAGGAVQIAHASALVGVVVALIGAVTMLFGNGPTVILSYYIGGAIGSVAVSTTSVLFDPSQRRLQMSWYESDLKYKGEAYVRSETRRLFLYALRANFLTWPLGILWFLFRKLVIEPLSRPARAA